MTLWVELTRAVASTRARGARRDQTDPHPPPGPRCGWRPPSPIPFYEVRRGAKDNDVGFARSGRRRASAAS
jgi:hypothetical protein